MGRGPNKTLNATNFIRCKAYDNRLQEPMGSCRLLKLITHAQDSLFNQSQFVT